MAFNGGDPQTMDRLAAACRQGATVLTEQVDQIRRLRGWLFGPSAVAAMAHLRRLIVPMLERMAAAMREMADVLTKNAQAQRDVSAGRPVDAAALPHYRRRTLSAEQRAVRGGFVQLFGGVLQAGGAVYAGFTGAGLPVAVGAGGLGVDNMVAGARSIIDQTPHETVVHQLAAGGAQQLGASPRVAWWVGLAAETGAGVGTGARMAVNPGIGLSDDAARLAPNTLIVGTRGGNSLDDLLGHNMVGSSITPTGARRNTALGHLTFEEADANRVSFSQLGVGSADALPRLGFSVRQIEVTAEQAQRARSVMNDIAGRLAGERQAWGVLGPNCTTAACEVLRGAGVDIPVTAQLHPRLLDLTLRELPHAAAGHASALGQGLGTASELGTRGTDP